MRKQKKITLSKVCLGKAVRFQNVNQVQAVEKAASRRGWSVNAFIIRVAYAAAQRELEMPTPDVFGVSIEELDQEHPAA